MRRIEVARLGADRSGGGTDEVGEDHPRAAQEAPDRAEQRRRRAPRCARGCAAGGRADGAAAVPDAGPAGVRRCAGAQPGSSGAEWGHGSPCSSGYREHLTSLSSHTPFALRVALAPRRGRG